MATVSTKKTGDFAGRCVALAMEMLKLPAQQMWLDYDKDAGIIKVTSRKFGKCVCAYAQCPQPAKALCTHCCKALQTELFKAMTGRDVTVQIDESILLGGERCRTTVRLSGNETK